MDLALSCVFDAVATMGFNSLNCLGIEMFLTSLWYNSGTVCFTVLGIRNRAVVSMFWLF